MAESCTREAFRRPWSECGHVRWHVIASERSMIFGFTRKKIEVEHKLSRKEVYESFGAKPTSD